MQNWSECGICFESFAEVGDLCPHVLPCGHSFCAKDITHLTVTNSKIFCCPICKSESDTFPPKNFVAIEALVKDREMELNESVSSSVCACSECDTKQASKYCPDCHQSFCDECNGIIHSLRINRSHIPGPISSKALFPLICTIHEEKMKLFCSNEQCRVPVCVLCASHGEHRGHQTCLLHEKVKEEKQALDRKLKVCHSKTDETQVLRQACSLARATLLEEHQKISVKVHADFEAAMNALKCKRDAIIMELLSHVNSRVANLEDYLTKTTTVLDESLLIQESTTQVLGIEGSHFMGKLKEINDLLDKAFDRTKVFIHPANSLQPSGVIEYVLSQEYETVLALVGSITAQFGGEAHFGGECLKWDESRKTINGTLLDGNLAVLRDGSVREWTCAVIGTKSCESFTVEIQEMEKADWMVGFSDSSKFNPNKSTSMHNTEGFYLFLPHHSEPNKLHTYVNGRHNLVPHVSAITLPGDRITVSKKGTTITYKKNYSDAGVEMSMVTDCTLYPVVMLACPNSKVTLVRP